MSVRFSIVVPVYNQWHLVPRLLHSLARQTGMSGKFELLLVDNGSREFRPPSDLPSCARLLVCETPGSYAARNKGIEHARGNWLIFTDADCAPADGWIEEIDRAVSSPDGETTLFAGAVQVVAEGDNEPNSYQIYDMVKGIPQKHYVRRGYGATANLCVPAKVIRAIGSFNPDLYSGGDADLCRRARANGYGLSYLPEARVTHPARDSWKALVTKARRVKGGQLTAGTSYRRTMYFVRSFMPPILAACRFLGRRELPNRFRIIAIAVQLRMWVVDMREALRVSFGAHPERK